MRRRYLELMILLLAFGACTKESKPPTKTAQGGDANRGRVIYLSYCAACHNSNDPSKDGPIGPAIQGSSQALLEAKVFRGGYPPGYKPKRKTAVMPAQPDLKSGIPDLAAFLGANSLSLEKNQE